MTSRAFLSILLSWTLVGCGESLAPAVDSVSAEGAATDMSAQTSQGRVGAHGMVVAGAPARVVLTHIPLYQRPHDVQLVLEGVMSWDGADAGMVPTTFDDRLYTFLPERMSLDALRLGALKEVRGTLFLGNFEAGGLPILRHVRVSVARVVHQHLLEVVSPEPAEASPELTYLLFGTRATPYAVHRIGAAPSFDELLRVELTGSDAPDDAALGAVVVATAAGVEDVVGERLGVRGSIEVTAGGATFELSPVVALSCLAGPDFASPCP